MFTDEQIKNLSLESYLKLLNKETPIQLTTCLNHWAGCGVHTAEQLGIYLDKELALHISGR